MYATHKKNTFQISYFNNDIMIRLNDLAIVSATNATQGRLLRNSPGNKQT